MTGSGMKSITKSICENRTKCALSGDPSLKDSCTPRARASVSLDTAMSEGEWCKPGQMLTASSRIKTELPQKSGSILSLRGIEN